jgi:hypothetical protein
MKTIVQWKCKFCQESNENEVDIDQVLVNNFENSIRQTVEENFKQKEILLKKQSTEFENLSKQLAKEKKEVDKLVNSKLKSQLISKEKELSERLERKIKEENLLKMKEKTLVIESLKQKVDEMQRKMEVSSQSQQLAGESLEITIEQQLRETHTLDEIISVGKGKPGADCIQKVKSTSGITIGSIIYEIKNTSKFNSAFITKLRTDNVSQKSELMVLVSRAMPTEKKFLIIDEVFICTPDLVREVSLILRFLLFKIESFKLKENMKSSKATLLYEYITAPHFANLFSQILDTAKALQDQHSQEKLRIQKIWRERELLIDRLLAYNISMYSDIRSISDESIPEIKMLSLPQVD